MPDDLVPVGGDEGGQVGEYEGDLGFPEETPETTVDDGTTVSSQDDTDSADTDQEEETQSTGEDTPEGDSAAASYNFRDKSYDTPESLVEGVNAFTSSWEGRMKAMQNQINEAEAINRKWQEWYDYQDAQAAKVPDKEPEPDPEPWDRVDWDKVDKVARAEGNVEGIKLATKQAFEAMKKDLGGEVGKVREELGTPIQNMEAEREYKRFAEDLWYKEALQVNESGEALYPELNETIGTGADPHAMKLVLGEWLRLRGDHPKFANSPAGIQAAYNNFKLWSIRTGYKSEQAKSAESETAKKVARDQVRNADGTFAKKNKARNDVASGGSATPTPSGDNSGGPPQSMSEAAQRRRIRDAGRSNVTAKDQTARNIFGVT
jgi:hypothetical protein